MILTEVWIAGHARTKGSLLNNQDTPQSKRWRALMAHEIRKDVNLRITRDATITPIPYPYRLAVAVEIDVWLPVADVIKAGAGDVDKLARNVLDAMAADAKNAIMNGGVIVNDNQVVRLRIDKWPRREPLAKSPPAGLLLSVETADHWRDDTQARQDAARVRGW